MSTAPAPAYQFGYVPNPKATAEFDEQIPKAYGDQLDALPYDLKQSAFPYRIVARYLKNAQTKFTNGRLNSKNQGGIGSCVGHGGASAAWFTTIGDILLRGDPERLPLYNNEYVSVSASACYGLSRMAGGALGGWQGSNGSWMTDALIKYGCPWEIKTDRYDLSQYRVADAASFQSRGVPQPILDDCAKNKFMAYARVRHPEQAVAAAQHGYGMHLCCGLGWSSGRDDDGFARRSGSWPHCQQIGICYVNYEGFGRRPARRGIGIQNSWGNNWNRGGCGGMTPDLPHGSYIWDYDDFAQCLERGALEIYIMGGYQGFLKTPGLPG